MVKGAPRAESWYNRRMNQKATDRNDRKPVDQPKHRAKYRGILLTLCPALALGVLGLSWPRIFAGQSEWIEAHYSGTVYQAIRRAISAVTSLAPFSIAELLLYALAVCIPALVAWRVIQVVLHRIPFRRLIQTLAAILLAGAVLLNLFYVTWGFNYFREPLSTRMGLNVAARSVDELEAFVLKTAKQARELRATLSEDENGVFAPRESDREILDALPQAYRVLSGRYPVFQADPTRAKRVLWSRGLSWQGIAGVYIGLTAEPNVNADQPPLLLYQAAAHEMAHQTGIASENEAEFTAYLACLSASDANVRYSGLMHALILAGNALYRADGARYLSAAETYGEALWRDLTDYDAYWSAFDGEVRESADKRNDVYLKHNSQESGIKSYGESVDLMLAFDAQNGE